MGRRRRGATEPGTGGGRHGAATAVAGAMAIASSGILVRLADVSPSTAATFRTLYAVPLLALVARAGRRGRERRTPRARALGVLAGAFLTADLVLWHHGIEAVGAGLATVLGNLQVVMVAGLAWAMLGERPSRSLFAALPVVLTGAVLISGVVGEGAYGEDPVLGAVLCLLTSVAYSGFLLVLRDLQRTSTSLAGPLLDAVVVSTVVSALVGVAMGDLDVVPSWPAHGWLAVLAVTAQVLGWLLIARSLPLLPAALASMLLLVQPVGALALAFVVLGEDPSAFQLLGCALIVLGVAGATAGRERRAGREPAPRGAAPEAVPVT